MARDGSGNYSNPYPDFVSGTVISSTQVDANNSDVAAALTQSIAVDGQSTVTANLPMNSKKLTGLAAGTAAADSLSLGQAQAEAMVWCGTAGGTADAITLAPSPAITAYAAGQRFVWKASGSANTGATTVAISGLGAIALQDNGAALVAGNHAAGKIFMGILDTTSTVQVMQVQISGTNPLIVTSLTVSGTATVGGILSVDDTTDTTSGTTGSIHTDGGLGVAKNLFVATNATVSGTTLMTGVTTHGGNVVSDTDSTDDLGTTGVRWANLFVDGITATDQITATGFTGTLDGVLGSGTPAAATVTTLSASGVTTVAAGTALLPSIVTTGDTNTGVWFPAADTVAASTAGTERMRIDSSGNVGISTTAPTSKLHVYGSLPVGGILVEDSSTSGASPAVVVIGKRSDANDSQVFSGRLALAKNQTNALVATNTTLGTIYFGGNHSDATLANIAYGASISGISTGAFNSAADMPSALAFHTGVAGVALTSVSNAGTERMRIDTSGNVGIGTTAPDVNLSVFGSAAVGAGVGGEISIGGFYDGSSKTSYGSIAGVNQNGTGNTSGQLLFKTRTNFGSLTERMRIDSSGNVGIGTTAPVQKLELNEDTTSGGPYLQFENRGTGTTDNTVG
jgi:hypothetical protein